MKRTGALFALVLAPTACIGEEKSTESGMGGGSTGCTPPAGGACELRNHCGCASGENCIVLPADFTTGKTSCVAAGTTGPYYPCTASSQCAVGYLCAGGACHPYCESSADCHGANRECQQIHYDGSVPVPGVMVCTSACDPVNPAGVCHGGTTCLPACTPQNTPVGNGTTDCFGAGTALAGQACSAYLDCAPGEVCAMATTGGTTCFKLCRFEYAMP